MSKVVAHARGAGRVCWLWIADIRDGRDYVPGHEDTVAGVVPRDVVGDYAEDGARRAGTGTGVGLEKLRDSLDVVHKFRRAMVRPGRHLLMGRIEVDETYLGGLDEELRGRLTEKKALIVVAAQEDGKGIGRIHMRQIPDASAESLEAFLLDSIHLGSVVHTNAGLATRRGDGQRICP